MDRAVLFLGAFAIRIPDMKDDERNYRPTDGDVSVIRARQWDIGRLPTPPCSWREATNFQPKVYYFVSLISFDEQQ